MSTSIDTTNSFISSLDEVKRHLRLGIGDQEHDGVLIAMVNHVATWFNLLTARNLKQRTYTEKILNGSGGLELSLPEYPVDRTAAFTLYADESRTFDATTLLTLWNDSGDATAAHFMLDDDIGVLERIDGNNWPSGNRTVKVTYTAGITVANAGDIIHAMLTQIGAWWAERGKELVGSYTLGGITESLASLSGTQGQWARTMHPFTYATMIAQRKPVF